jgi:hypothetical protein
MFGHSSLPAGWPAQDKGMTARNVALAETGTVKYLTPLET